jgi:hypothetical protein
MTRVKIYAELTGNRKKQGIKSLCDNKNDRQDARPPIRGTVLSEQKISHACRYGSGSKEGD